MESRGNCASFFLHTYAALDVKDRVQFAWANWEEGPPTDIDRKFRKLYGYPPQNNAQYYRGQCSSLQEPDTHSNSSEECVHSHSAWFGPDEDLTCYRDVTTESLALFIVRMESIIMGRQFVERKDEHLQEQIVMEGQFVERRAQRP